jgi:hypothetical protein
MDEIFTPDELCDYIKISQRTLYHLPDPPKDK